MPLIVQEIKEKEKGISKKIDKKKRKEK